MNTTITTPVIETVKYAGQYTKTQWLELTATERRQIGYNRYLLNVANKPKVSYDSQILAALYEIIYFITGGIIESFDVVKGNVSANVTIKDNGDFCVRINTPTQYYQLCDDMELVFIKLKIKALEKIVGAKVVKVLKAELPVEAAKVENDEVFEIGKSSVKKLSATQIKQYDSPKENKAIYANGLHPYWMQKMTIETKIYFAPVNAVDFKINLEYFQGFEYFAIESKNSFGVNIQVTEKSTGFQIVNCLKSELSEKLIIISEKNQENQFSELVKKQSKVLPFSIEPNEGFESINKKRIEQNEIYVFGLIEPIQAETETTETVETNEPTNQVETMQATTNEPETTAQEAPLEVDQTIQCEGYRLVVTAVKQATNFDTVANFAKLNKNDSLAGYYKECSKCDYTQQRIKVLGTLSVNNKLFGELSNSLMSDWTIANLEKFGGSESNDPRLDHIDNFYKMTENDRRIYNNTYFLNTLQVTNAETKETFYVDSQGYNYARYVGLPINVEYENYITSKVIEQPEPITPTFEKKETRPGVWELSNEFCYVEIDLGNKRIGGGDLTDHNNMPRFYNQTTQGIKKATQAILDGFNKETKMYDAARLAAPFVRCRSYCAMD